MWRRILHVSLLSAAAMSMQVILRQRLLKPLVVTILRQTSVIIFLIPLESSFLEGRLG